MFTLPDGVKALNLPEQVQKNIDDIASLNTALDTKQDSSNAVTTDNLADHIKNIDLTEHDLSTNTLEASESITDSGTLSVEGKAEFGGDVEVDGSVTLNSPDDVKFKTGSLDFSDLTSFIDTYYSNIGVGRFAGTHFRKIGSEESIYTDSDICADFAKYKSWLNIFDNCSFKDNTGASPFPLTIRSSETIHLTGTMPAWRYAFLDCNVEDIIIDADVECNDTSDGLLYFASYVKTLSITSGHVVKVGRYFNWPFNNAANLVSVSESDDGTGYIDCSNATQMILLISSSPNVKSLSALHHIKVSFDISASTAFEESDLVTILNHLDSVTTTQTLTMGSTNLAKLTNDDILIATGKGWVLS